MSQQTACEIPARWRWHYDELLDLRDQLLEARERGLHDAEVAAEWATDPVDNASEMYDRDLAITLLSSEMDSLYEVEAALSRIEDGTYGVCEFSGQPIPADRLRALPWTRFCRSAAEKLIQPQHRFAAAPIGT